MKSGWLRIDNVVPTDGQNVAYYFGFFDEVCLGTYRKGTPEIIDGEEILIADHFFIGGGFLGDDVTYWMPHNFNDPIPEPPTVEEKMRDLYHPTRKCLLCGMLIPNHDLRNHAELNHPDEWPYK